MALSDNLVSYWELEETSGTRADSQGSADLTDYNTVGYTTGIQGNGADFVKANSEYFKVTDSSLNVQSDFSISFWASSDSTSVTQRIMTFYGGNNNGRIEVFQASDNSFRALYYDNSGNRTYKYAASMFPATGTLYHFVCAVDVSAKTIDFYRNGTQLSTTNVALNSTSLGSNGGAFAMGAFTDGSDTWGGTFDEFGFWGRYFSGTDVTDLYNSGAGMSYADITGGGSSPSSSPSSSVSASPSASPSATPSPSASPSTSPSSSPSSSPSATPSPSASPSSSPSASPSSSPSATPSPSSSPSTSPSTSPSASPSATPSPSASPSTSASSSPSSSPSSSASSSPSATPSPSASPSSSPSSSPSASPSASASASPSATPSPSSSPSSSPSGGGSSPSSSPSSSTSSSPSATPSPSASPSATPSPSSSPSQSPSASVSASPSATPSPSSSPSSSPSATTGNVLVWTGSAWEVKEVYYFDGDSWELIDV